MVWRVVLDRYTNESEAKGGVNFSIIENNQPSNRKISTGKDKTRN